MPNTCPVCGKPLDGYEQPAFGGIPARRFEHCTSRGCDLEMITLEAGEHARLTNAQIDEYAAVNRRIRSLA